VEAAALLEEATHSKGLEEKLARKPVAGSIERMLVDEVERREKAKKSVKRAFAIKQATHKKEAALRARKEVDEALSKARRVSDVKIDNSRILCRNQTVSIRGLKEKLRTERQKLASAEHTLAEAIGDKNKKLVELQKALATSKLAEDKRQAAFYASAGTEGSCAICLDNFTTDRPRIALDCGHAKACAVCSSDWVRRHGRCPWCSKVVNSSTRIYL